MPDIKSAPGAASPPRARSRAPRPAAGRAAANAVPNRSEGQPVVVVGGGLAGMTAALHLAKSGFDVTLYEASDRLGGNTSSTESPAGSGAFHDVYPHMFCDWYLNFWRLFEDELGLSRDAHFKPHTEIRILNEGAADYIVLRSGFSPGDILDNLRSGLASWADIFLLGFSLLDLAAHPFDRTQNDMFSMLDVNGFLYSRGYATESVARIQDYILMMIWSVQSDMTAAATYQEFVRHTFTFPRRSPFWMLRSSLQEGLVAPLEKRLEELGVEIRKNTKLDTVILEDRGSGPKPRLEFANADPLPCDLVVLAVPGPELARLAVTAEATDFGKRLADHEPKLYQLGRFWGESIPVVDICFKRKLDGIPEGMFGLRPGGFETPLPLGVADWALSCLDISQLWSDDPDMGDRTVLVVAASNGYAFQASTPEALGHMLIKAYSLYNKDINPGTCWGDPDCDIDWSRTFARSNSDHLLFINDVGSWNWRPTTADEKLPGVFLAGDYCQTSVGMATMEAAVESGLNAAAAVQRQTGRGDPVETIPHRVYSDAAFQAVKLAWLPLAYGAAAWSNVEAAIRQREAGPLPANVYSTAAYNMVLPIEFVLDWVKTAYWLGRRLLPGGDGDHDRDDGAASGDEEMSILRGLLGSLRGPIGGSQPGGAAPPRLAEAAETFLRQLGRTAQAALGAAPGPAPAAPPRRRARIKE